MRRFFGLLMLSSSLAHAQDPAYQTFDLGKTLQQAETIKSMRAQRELMEAQAAAERARIAREQEVGQRTEAPPPIVAQAESVSESDVRFLKFLSQNDACKELYAAELERSKCINQLRVSDSDYARTWVEVTTPGIETQQTHARRVQLFAQYRQRKSSPGAKTNATDESGVAPLTVKP